LVVEIFTEGVVEVPVALAGKLAFGSNGVKRLAPAIPKAIATKSPGAERLTVIVGAEPAFGATAYHTSKSASLADVEVTAFRFVHVKLGDVDVTEVTVGGAAADVPCALRATTRIRISLGCVVLFGNIVKLEAGPRLSQTLLTVDVSSVGVEIGIDFDLYRM
jgi:hypothetical protein